jgi:hypothetical protein
VDRGRGAAGDGGADRRTVVRGGGGGLEMGGLQDDEIALSQGE